MNWLKRILISLIAVTLGPGSAAQQATAKNPLIVTSPRIGFFNLLGLPGQSLVEEDKQALQPFFSSVEESSDGPPVCDVLMIYARVEGDGRVAGSANGLREIIRKSKAVIVIVASENEAKNYIAAAKSTGYGRANLVMTLDRKGAAFGKFFAGLFEKMRQGTSMPQAWVELAPQVPGARHENCPESIFAAEIGQIAFK
jgi:hypothetical protein